MIFKLTPPSGYADSYLDIEFSVILDQHPKTEITLFNDTSKEQLNIIGISTGYISNNIIIVKSSKQVSGHINLFSDDKMNKKFKFYNSVNIRCHTDYYNEENTLVLSDDKTVIFYNESQSLDANIVPFDIIVRNNIIDFGKKETLIFDLISRNSRKYEICIKSQDESVSCTIEISSKLNKTTVEIPWELLYHDLNLKINKNKQFQMFYVCIKGTNLSRLANRQYVPLEACKVKFIVPEYLTLTPQSRKGPIGELSNKFIISDRYFVLCPKEYSGFAKKSEFAKEKLMDLTMLVNEGQHMESLSKQIKGFSDNKDVSQQIQNTQKIIQHNRNHNKMIPVRPKINNNQIQLLKSVSGIYENIAAKSKPQQQASIFSAASIKSKEQQKCAPCARKKQPQN